MDSVTQLALGSAVGYAVIGNKVGRKAIAWGAALGTLPDLDVLVPFDHAVAAFTYHRSWSHSLFVHLLMTPFIVWLIQKLHPTTKAHTSRWFWMVFLCLSTHAILDSFTVYGTQLFWPLTEYPVAISNIFIIDPLVTLPLLIGVGIALFAKRHDTHNTPHTTQPSVAQTGNRWGLAIALVYLSWSLVAKVAIDNKINTALQSNAINTKDFVSTPAPFTTLLWRFVAMQDEQYLIGYVSVFDDVEDVELTFYSTQPDLLNAIEEDWGIERLKWFTKGFNAVRLEQEQIVMSDLRMGVECGYVFNFVVGTLNENGVSLGSYEQFSERSDMSKIHFFWQRIWDPTISLAPGGGVLSQC